MVQYVVLTHVLNPEELFKNLGGLEGVVVESSKKIGEIGHAVINTGMPIKALYAKLGYDRYQVTIAPIKYYKTQTSGK